ncbi:MAG: T9SS C-terminal target domain-containing protein [Cytophagales bacterium]|nr:MAG: T9SS C-terminal target domain-containing protein [Cytophagales bacterium]
MTKYSFLWLLLCWPGMVLAQLTITSPQSRIVYQRNGSNQATVVVSGLAPLNSTRVEARLVALPGYSGATTGWSSLNIISSNKAFRGALTGSGGWYRLEVRSWADNNMSADGSVDRVGVGEVFVVAGQSNAYGGNNAGGAADDRVSVVDFRDSDVNEQLLPVRFSHAESEGNVGPSNPLFIWGQLGDKLVRRLQVPVLFLGAAQSGTTSEQWRKSAEGDGNTSAQLFPYRRLGSVLYHYIARTGARAVLWHQGEGDIGRGQQQYIENIQFIINKSRQQTNFGSLAWVVSRATYLFGQTDGSIINAQNQLINNVPNVFAGPNTDALGGTENRGDNVHFSGLGLPRLVDLWNQSLTDDFFNRSQPFSPSSDAPSLTTGYILPNAVAPGSKIWVPYVQRGPFEGGNQFKAQLLNAGGGVVAESSLSTQNPIPVSLPGNLPSGTYRARVVSTIPNLVGSTGESFQVTVGGSGGSNTTPTQPAVTGGTPDASINRIGYKYDAPSHGFHFLIGATGPVEARLERIDGGYFGETNWGSAGDNNDQAGFNKLRYYGPVAVGVGGVEAGRYRLSVRKAGDQGAGIWVEVNLLDGRTTVYASTDGSSTDNSTPPPPPSTPVEQPISPGFTPPTVDNVGTIDYIRQIGYKYDMPTHGFQLLALTQGTVEMKLERLDGPFGETNWGASTASSEYGGYSQYRYYAPIGMGVGGVEPGRYRLSVRKPGDSGSGQSVDVTLQNGQFKAGAATVATVPVSTPAPAPVQQSAQPGTIQAIGYKYDMPTHGFQLLAQATVSVQMRLERLDGAFNETAWGDATNNSDYAGYNQYRYYAPLGLGIGGVEPGRYRLWVRKTGDSGNGQSVDVTLQNGIYQVSAPNARIASESSPEVTLWQVYPNPAETEVIVTGPVTETATALRMVLTNASGQEKAVGIQAIQPGRYRVNLGTAQTGLYVLRILDGERPLETLKVLKVK